MIRHGEPEEEIKLTKDLFWRVMRFARPYRRRLLILLAAILMTSVLSVLIPPFLTKSILDDAIGRRDLQLLYQLCAAYLAVIAGQGILQIGSRWMSSRIGEGLIFDLRVALFDHVQRLPIAFFTRTHTGALISRMKRRSA
jgi:ATP-binding cassette subfamily B protein